MKKLSLLFLLFFLHLTFVFGQNLTVRDIMREPSLAGMRAESARLSPDGSKIVFLWNAERREPRDLYLVSSTGGAPAKILSPPDLISPTPTPTPESKLNYGLTVRDDFTKSRENQFGGIEWSPDSRKIIFTQSGDLFVLTIGEAKPHRLTKTQSAEFAARFLDNRRILFSQNGNIFVIDTENVSLIQLTREANPQTFVSIFNATPNEKGDLIAYTVSDGSRQRALFVPNYLGEFTTAPTFRRGFTEQKIFAAKTDGTTEKPFEIQLPKAEGAGYVRGLRWSASGDVLFVDRIDRDTKRRQLFVVSAGALVENAAHFQGLIEEETDEKWIAPLSRIVEPSPKGSQILFASEKSGFNHLYLATYKIEKRVREGEKAVEVKQLTSGNYEIDWAKWSADGKYIIYSSTEANTAEREFYVLIADGSGNWNRKTKVPSQKSGMRTSPQIDKTASEPTLLFEFSRWNEPTELYAVKICPECASPQAPRQLTGTVPERFRQTKWSEPKFISVKSKDGKNIPAKIYLPDNFNKSKKYPMVIFVHGAGYLQNVINGWNNYYREFMFHTILTRRGYVVLDIDFRGSAGYGRDWRTDVHDFLGGLDYEDHIDSIAFMVKNYSVNPQKVGVYGGSYGGFMAQMLVMRAPEKIAAAAALRPVADWKNYFAASPVYTTERLGFPDKNPEAYRRSSPITYADQLQKPLLILHGLLDDNVHAQDSIQLIEKLMRLEKTAYFDAMLYPAENHAFQRPSSWADQYERILTFFEKHLK